MNLKGQTEETLKELQSWDDCFPKIIFNKAITVIQQLKERLFKEPLRDPCRECEVWKTVGCPHIDSYLCDMEDCSILKKLL